MKRVIALALAATLLGSTAASAQGWGHHYRGGWNHGYGYHHNHGDAAAAIGLGIFALGALAIISSQNAHRYNGPAYDSYGPPPPPPSDRYYSAPGNYDYDYDAPPPPYGYDDDAD
jgi:hypothetical protein